MGRIEAYGFANAFVEARFSVRSTDDPELARFRVHVAPENGTEQSVRDDVPAPVAFGRETAGPRTFIRREYAQEPFARSGKAVELRQKQVNLAAAQRRIVSTLPDRPPHGLPFPDIISWILAETGQARQKR
jgi:hypothetical protein